MKHILRTSIATAVAAAGLALPMAVAAPAAASTCQKYVATSGSDANPGTREAPYRSLDRLVAGVGAGGTGCVTSDAVYYAVQGNGVIAAGGAAGAPVTITGESQGAVVKGQLWIRPESHDLTFTGLRFLGNYGPGGVPNGTKATHLIVHGDRIGFLDNEISDPRGICIGAGKADQLDAAVNDVAEDLRVVGNEIHHCGMAGDISWAPRDSGAHGVYLENTRDAVVAHNRIHDNRYRGLQLWPRNDGAHIHHNLFSDNATHVNIGSSLSCDGGCRTVRTTSRTTGTFKAENTDVHDNIFMDRVTDWRPEQNPSQVYGFFPFGSPTYGNDVHHNCFAPGDASTTGDGYARHDNSVVSPVFEGSRLAAGSPCIGKGPADIQPDGTEPEDPEEPEEPEEPVEPTFLVDALVTAPSGAVKGDGTINTTGAGQTVQVTRRAGRTVTVPVSIQNDGSAVDAWSIADQVIGTAGFRATWTLEGQDVTSLVRSGNLLRHHVAPGSGIDLLLSVKVTRRASGTATWLLHGVHNPLSDGIRDVVKVSVTRR